MSTCEIVSRSIPFKLSHQFFVWLVRKFKTHLGLQLTRPQSAWQADDSTETAALKDLSDRDSLD